MRVFKTRTSPFRKKFRNGILSWNWTDCFRTSPFRKKFRNGIPRIIHQVWNDHRVPTEFDAFRASWIRENVGWDYQLWTFDDGAQLIARHYPRLMGAFCSLPKVVQKADLLRYVILHRYGGVYADMDAECVRPFDHLIDGADFVAGFEQKDYPSVCNAILCSLPGHPALAAILRWLEGCVDRTTIDANDVSHVFATTGSVAITPLILANATDRTRIYPPSVFYPFSWAEKEKCGEHFPLAWAKHYWVSGWYDEGAYRVGAYWVDKYKFAMEYSR